MSAAALAYASLQNYFWTNATSDWGCGPASDPLREGAHIRPWWLCAQSLVDTTDALLFGIIDPDDASDAFLKIDLAYQADAEYRPFRLRFQGNDDVLWWALAWFDAAYATGNSSYVAAGLEYVARVAGYWDSSCGGGVWWDRQRTYKNAVTNELFILACARAYLLTKDDVYRVWAKSTWDWFWASGMVGANSLVCDGLNADCTPNNQNPWTYNQGIIAEAAAALAATGAVPSTAMLQAGAIPIAALRAEVDENGVLVEQCEPNCDNDAKAFKGILVRRAARLAASETLYFVPCPSAIITPLRQLIARNAAAVVSHAAPSGNHTYALSWGQPYQWEKADVTTHSSALALLIADQLLNGPRAPLRS